jgi:hypothetical protein
VPSISASALRPGAPAPPAGWWFPLWYAGALAIAGAGLVVGGPGLGLLAALAMLAAWALSGRPLVSAYALAAIVPVTSGLSRGVPIPGLRVSEVLTMGLGALILVTADHRRDSRWTAVDAALALYALASFALGLLSRYEASVAVTTDDLGVVSGPLQYLVFFRALALALNTPAARRGGLLVALAASVPISGLAIAQGLSPSVDAFVKSLTGYEVETYGRAGGLERATSLFPHFQVLSAYLAAIVLTGFALVVLGGLGRRARWATGAMTALAGVALVETVTLTTIAGTVAGVVAIAAASPERKRWLGGLAVAGAVLAVAFSGTLGHRIAQQSSTTAGTVGSDRNPLVPQTVAYRYEVWTRQSLPVIEEHALLGVGPTLPESVAWKSTESMYITLLFRGGLVLLGAFLLVIGALVRSGWRARRLRDPCGRAAGVALLVLSALLVPMCFIQPYLTYGGVSHVLFLLAAAAGSARLAEAGPPRRVEA